MDNVLVSVVITTFRRPKYILEAVNSVLEQTYRNIELIIVDDNGAGTADQLTTAEVIGRLGDARLKYIALEHNAGPSAARNAGIKAAVGTFVAFLDDDDIMLPEKIEKQLRYMQSHSDYCGCGSWLRRFYENGFEFDVMTPDGLDVVLTILKFEQTYSTCTLFIKRQALLDVGMFDPEFRGLEDPELVLRLSLSYQFGIVEEVLTLVRTRDEIENARSHEKWFLKFLEKHEAAIRRLPRRDRKQVYFNTYYNLSKKFLQNRDYRKTIGYLFRCGNPFKYLYLFATDAIAYRRRQRRIKETRPGSTAG